MLDKLKDEIGRAYEQACTQYHLMALSLARVTDIREGRVDLSAPVPKSISIDKYVISKGVIADVVGTIQKNPDHYVRALCSNMIRGTCYPLLELLKHHDDIRSEMLRFFPDESTFTKYKYILEILRHTISHNLNCAFTICNKDMEGRTIKAAKNDYSVSIDFNYDPHKYFPEVYDAPTIVNVCFYTEKYEVGNSLFDCLSPSSCLFVGEVANNCLSRLWRRVHDS
jgi:hypothetical protein